ERVGRMLLPVAVGLEHHRRATALRAEVRHDVLDEPRPDAPRERALVLGAHARLGSVTAEQDREAQLDPAIGDAAAHARSEARLWPEHDARREVLDLALAVDRGIRDDGDRLVEVVREVRASVRERRERSVPSERADRLVRGLGHELRHAEVVGLEPERGELLLAPLRDVLELVGRPTDLPARGGLARRAAPLLHRDRLFGTARLHAGTRARRGDVPHLAVRGEARAERRLVDEPPAARAAPQGDALAGAERVRIADVLLERHEAALAREDVGLGRLDMPERTEPERVDAKDRRVADAREE